MIPSFTVLLGDCLEHIPAMPAHSVDALITDPPYGLSFMGKGWDRGVPGVAYWAECLRVLKPGGHLLAFGGTRTYHRLASAIEDAGFEIRDQIQWLYGSGFPKSLDISKAVDKAAGAVREVVAQAKPVKRLIPGAAQHQTGSWIKDNGREFVQQSTIPATNEAKQWDGWGTALKPACEPICVARKPLTGTVVANVLEHGTGGLNIDACKVGDEVLAEQVNGKYPENTFNREGVVTPKRTGRWPANVILDEEAGQLLDAMSGELTSGENPAKRGADKHRNVYAGWKGEQCLVRRPTNSGGASRFFYCAKASRSERGHGNDHPTVKPIALMRYLCRLVTPPNGLILDPFMGSGTTGVAAIAEGFRFIGIDLEPGHCEIARKRLAGVTPGMVFDDEMEDVA